MGLVSTVTSYLFCWCDLLSVVISYSDFDVITGCGLFSLTDFCLVFICLLLGFAWFLFACICVFVFFAYLIVADCVFCLMLG